MSYSVTSSLNAFLLEHLNHSDRKRPVSLVGRCASGLTLLQSVLAGTSLTGWVTSLPQVNRSVHQPLTSSITKPSRGRKRSVVHHRVLPTSDGEVLCHCFSSRVPFQCLILTWRTQVQSHCHSPFVPIVSTTHVGSLLLRTITGPLHAERMSS